MEFTNSNTNAQYERTWSLWIYAVMHHLPDIYCTRNVKVPNKDTIRVPVHCVNVAGDFERTLFDGSLTAIAECTYPLVRRWLVTLALVLSDSVLLPVLHQTDPTKRTKHGTQIKLNVLKITTLLWSIFDSQFYTPLVWKIYNFWVWYQRTSGNVHEYHI